MTSKTLKVSAPKSLTLRDLSKTGAQALVSSDNLKRKRDQILEVAKRIAKSPDKAILIPYLVRGLLDYSEKRPLTKLQKKLVLPLVNAGLDKRLLQRFQALPNKTVKAFDQRYFKTKKAATVDKLFKSQMILAAKEVVKDISVAPHSKYIFAGPYRDISFITTTNRTFQEMVQEIPSPEPPCPPFYQLRLEYRGITTRKVHDRSGGVEPYLITGLYRIPYELFAWPEVMHEMSPRMKVEHHPENLGEMKSGYWSPSGGSQDTNGNPVHPIQFYPKFFTTRTISLPSPFHDIYVEDIGRTSIDVAPYLRKKDLHFALVSVWEQDGDQSAQIMENIGTAMASMGPELMAMIGSAVAIPTGVTQVLGIVILVIGVALYIASLLTGDEDDHIGDFILVFDQEASSVDGYREVSQRVSNNDNDWTIYLGVETKSLATHAT